VTNILACIGLIFIYYLPAGYKLYEYIAREGRRHASTQAVGVLVGTAQQDAMLGIYILYTLHIYQELSRLVAHLLELDITFLDKLAVEVYLIVALSGYPIAVAV
jgi:hypothetical protein